MFAAFGANAGADPRRGRHDQGAIARAEATAAAEPDRYFLPQQFKNQANPGIHEQTTGPEIWNDTDCAIDVLVSGVGTGGTITGVSRYIKKTKGKDITSVAVEPAASPSHDPEPAPASRCSRGSTRSKASAPASSPTPWISPSLTASSWPPTKRPWRSPAAWPAKRASWRHLQRRGRRGCLAAGQAGRVRGKDHRRGPARLRRALYLDRALRRNWSGGRNPGHRRQGAPLQSGHDRNSGAPGLSLGFWPLLSLAALQLALTLSFGPRLCLACLIYFKLVQPRLGPGPIKDARPVCFANWVGLAFLSAASVAHLAGYPRLGWALGLLVAALALLAAASWISALLAPPSLPGGEADTRWPAQPHVWSIL